MSVKDNKVVAIHYTLTLDDGTIVDTTTGNGPLEFIFGTGLVIKGLEKALFEKNVGDSFKVSVNPEEAYGFERMENIKTIEKSHFEDPDSIKIGTQFQVESGAIAVVTNVTNDSVSLNLNHPLAGKILHFDISVEDLRDATAKELLEKRVIGKDSDCECC